jgi:hypothetical protein
MNWSRKTQMLGFCCLFSCKVLTAGDTIPKWFTPTEISVHYGFDLFRQTSNFNIANFSRLAPEGINFNPGELPYKSKRAYTGWAGRPNFLGAYNNSFSLMLGHEFSSKRACAPKRRLRYGLTYLSAQGFTVVAISENSKHLDSSYNWYSIEADSVNRNYVVLDYLSDHLRINVSMLLESRHSKRLNYYGGLGISGGISLNQMVMLTNESMHFKQYKGGYPPVKNDLTLRQTPYRSVTSYSLSAFLPLGLGVRLDKKGISNHNTHIYLELQPGINTMHIPRVITYALFAIHGVLGLRSTF